MLPPLLLLFLRQLRSPPPPLPHSWKIAEHFDADIVPIAWSGKGMYQNCCDDGERMPAYWLQTLGGGEFTTDWDHSRYVPVRT